MSVSLLCPVEIGRMRDWITAIPFDEWHQSHPGRPSMMTDLKWHDFGGHAAVVVQRIAPYLPHGFQSLQHMLSVVMPYDWITPHCDGAPYPDWWSRIHVPLTSNDKAWFISQREVYHLEPGYAYKVDMTKEHAVTNGGETPRIHFMFDVRVPA